MKNYVSVHGEYYKPSQAAGEMGHVDRLYAENKNAFAEYTKFNFGSDFDLHERYKEIHAKRQEIRKATKKANTFLDIVVGFSLEQYEYLEKEKGMAGIEKAMKEHFEIYMKEMKDKYGLEPVGFKMHLDEGYDKQFKAYENQQERLKSGESIDDDELLRFEDLSRNIHAHVVFYNYDFKNKCSPLRKFTRTKTFSEFQDLAGKVFEPLGFERGISKTITNAKHAKKMAYIEQKLKEKTELVDKKDEVIKNQATQILNNMKTISNQKKESESLVSSMRGYQERFLSWFKKISAKVVGDASKEAKNVAESINSFSDDKVRTAIQYDTEVIEDKYSVEEKNKVSSKIKIK